MNLSLLPILLASNKYRLIDIELPTIPGLGLPAGVVITLGLIALAIVIGVLFARAVRMADYGWKISLILATLFVSLFVTLFGEYKLGVDLKGGVILVYGVDKQATAALNSQGRGDQWDMGQLIAVIGKRLNPEGLKEIVVRPFGQDQVEIVVPETDQREVEVIKEKIRTGGVLQFMIVAGDRDTELLELARQQSEKQAERLRPDVTDSQGHRVGFWARMGREEGDPKTVPFRSPDLIDSGFLRDARTGSLLELTESQKRLFATSDSAFKAFLEQRGTREVDVLMVYDSLFDIRGDDLAVARASFDQTLRPCIEFSMKGEGVYKMGYLTQNNLQRKLAIIFDNVVLSAPVIQSKISDHGQITGSFAQEKVDFIVGILRSGSMPVVMQKQPVSENQIGAILGYDTIRQGSWSVIWALALVFAFMLVYYRFSGAVASFALGLNLLMTIAIMVMLQAPLTLPGLAGLVLTVAMSVDANVLISERMREELQRGAALRMAIRNGFDKALSAIVDGNLTTFLTALVLYFIGTDQVKGFGMTLMLGNITSMFTAIFCARVILDIGERTRWIKTLRMGSFLTRPTVDWVPFLPPAIAGSVILIVIGLVATVARGKGLFDIDLAGGTSVTFLLKNPTPEEEVRKKLDAVFDEMQDPATHTSVDHNVYGMTVAKQTPGTVYKVDSSLEDVELLKTKVREALKLPNGEDGLKTFQMELGTVTETPVEIPAPPTLVDPKSSKATEKDAKKAPAKTDSKKTEVPAKATEQAKPAETPPAEPAPTKEGKKEGTQEGAKEESGESSSCDGQATADQATPAPADAEKSKESPAPANTQSKTEAKGGEAKGKTEPAVATPAAKTTEPGAETPATTPETTKPATTVAPKALTKATLRFPGSAIGADALRQRLTSVARAVLGQDLDISVDNPNWDGIDNSTFEEWTVTLPVDKEQAEKVLKQAKSELESEVVWQTSSKIGGQVSADTRWRAVGALAVSMLGIVAYVWFRFQKVAWGLAAVAALAHDALVMLTSIALSYWLVTALGFLGVEEFKISLPVVAAFLTILGYSVNDTIVIFDRLREIRGKSPYITRQMLNDAVNQTLGRTVILFGITLVVVGILYAFGGAGIHAFAFALVTGVISGCYSTLAIAAPILLWLLSKGEVRETSKVSKREVPSRVASPSR
jgi:SecD/SecF fusion protein